MDPALEQLLGAARAQTLSAFERAVQEGERDPVTEAGEYRRRRRDYATWLRMEEPAPEASELAARLLSQHRLTPDHDARREFELALTGMLASLYEDFLQRTQE